MRIPIVILVIIVVGVLAWFLFTPRTTAYDNWQDTVDNGADAETPGCHVNWSNADGTGVRVEVRGDACTNEYRTLNEWTNTAVHRHGPATDITTYSCNTYCASGGKCVEVDDVCELQDGSKIASAKCLCG